MDTIRWLPLVILLLAMPAPAQEGGDDAGKAIPADPYERGTPKRSAEGLIAAADAGDYETAAEYLDLRNLRGEARDLTGAQLARRLFVIVQRAEWLDVSDLVDDPAGRHNDNLPDYRDAIGTVVDEARELELYMQRVPRGDGVFIWKVSNASVSLIPQLYDVYGYPEYIEKLRRSVPDVSFVGMELFKWMIILSVALSIYVAVFLAALLVRRALGDPGKPAHRRIFRFLVLPLGIWFVLMAANYVATMLGRGAAAEEWERLTPIPILITVWALFATTNLFRDIAGARFEREGRAGATVFLRPAGNAIKLLIVVGAGLTYLNQLGINITTVLAGLGVGGIAVALALQKPMEDIFGAITLYAQQPVRLGDFCRIGNQTGTIEEIGLRTTRIRTLANTVIAIPNAKLASEPIDNISARHKILFRNDLRLRYDTTPDQIEKVLAGCRALFADHERVLADGQRVRLYKIGGDGLLVEVFVYINTTDWPEYLKIAEELNKRILTIIADAGTSLSPPAQALQIEQANTAA